MLHFFQELYNRGAGNCFKVGGQDKKSYQLAGKVGGQKQKNGWVIAHPAQSVPSPLGFHGTHGSLEQLNEATGAQRICMNPSIDSHSHPSSPGVLYL